MIMFLLYCNTYNKSLFKFKLISIARSEDIYKQFLDWKMDEHSFQFDHCFCVSFSAFYVSSIPQISMTPDDSKTSLNINVPSSCFFVIIGSKNLNMIGKVMDIVNSLTNDIGGTRPMAVFLMTNYKENVDIDVDYGFERYKSTPVMVK